MVTDDYTITKCVSNIAVLPNKKESIKEYLLEEVFSYWARAYANRICYNIMTMNNAESVNGLFKNAREFS